jgi:hypothetical protein
MTLTVSSFLDRTPRCLALVVGLGLSFPAFASTEELTCPASIGTQESPSADVPDGWSVRATEAPHVLAKVSFFEGDPSRQIGIVPRQDKRVGKDHVLTWSFVGDGDLVWIACRYQQTNLMLTHELARQYRQCRVIYGPDGAVKTISCQKE